MDFIKAVKSMRHHPLLKNSFIWNFIRKPYFDFINLIYSKSGIKVNLGGNIINLLPRFSGLDWETAEGKLYRLVSEKISPGDVFVDVGAHIGTYSVIASKKGCKKVIAYEPSFFTRNLLRKSLKINNVMRTVDVRSTCLSNCAGERDFYFLPGKAEGKCGLLKVNGFSKTKVRVDTLDNECDKLGIIPDHIKIDVEGTEFDVLKGADSILRQYKPSLFLSLHPGALTKLKIKPEMILEYLTQRGYSWKVIDCSHEMHIFAE